MLTIESGFQGFTDSVYTATAKSVLYPRRSYADGCRRRERQGRTDYEQELHTRGQENWGRLEAWNRFTMRSGDIHLPLRSRLSVRGTDDNELYH